MQTFEPCSGAAPFPDNLEFLKIAREILRRTPNFPSKKRTANDYLWISLNAHQLNACWLPHGVM